jgi:hypothetical protein
MAILKSQAYIDDCGGLANPRSLFGATFAEVSPEKGLTAFGLGITIIYIQ